MPDFILQHQLNAADRDEAMALARLVQQALVNPDPRVIAPSQGALLIAISTTAVLIRPDDPRNPHHPPEEEPAPCPPTPS